MTFEQRVPWEIYVFCKPSFIAMSAKERASFQNNLIMDKAMQMNNAF